MMQILALLILLAFGFVSYYIFRHGLKKDDPAAESCMKGCMGCGAAEFCSDVKKFSALADQQAKRNESL